MAVEAAEVLRMIVSMPPGHAKSRYCSQLFPAWYMGRHPNNKYLQAGHTQTFVENKYSKQVRAIIKMQEWRDIFGEIYLSKDTKAANEWALENGRGAYVAKGIGQGISGVRANCAGIDDPFASRADAESPAIRELVWSWFIADFRTRLLPRSPIFLVQTRWHPDDLAGRIDRELHKKGKGLPWEIINLPIFAEDDPENPDPLNRRPGELLWPDFFDEQEIIDIRETSIPREWQSLYCGKPIRDEGEMLNVGWFQEFEVAPEDKKDEKGQIIERFVKRRTISVDCANKAKERNDYTVIQCWIETMDGKHYLVNQFRERLNFDQLITKIENAARLHHAQQILVEDAGAGTQYIQTRSGKAPCPVIPIPTTNIKNAKEFRFDSVVPMIQAGLVYIPNHGSWVGDYLQELVQFPYGTNDDQVDATSQYLAHYRRNRTYGTKKLHGANYHEDKAAILAQLPTGPTPSPKIGG